MIKNPLLNIRFLILWFFLTLALHALALYNYWYWTVWWFDIPMHIIGGFLVGATYLWYLKMRKKTTAGLFMVLGVVLAIGLMWELHEFLYDLILKHSTPMISTVYGRLDTIKDLADDLLGGILVYVWLREQNLEARK